MWKLKRNKRRSSMRRMRLRRRRRLYIRRALVLLCAALIVALLIAIPIWIVRAVRDADNDSLFGKTKQPAKSTAPIGGQEIPDEERPVPVVGQNTVLLGSEVSSAYVVLLDMTDNRIVAAKNADVQHPPASITKVMTLLVAVEKIPDLDAEYTMSWKIINPPYQQGANVTGLLTDETVRLEDLLYGCVLPSGADATAALADYVTDGEVDYGEMDEAVFAQMMTDKAQELGAVNTRFTNTSGLHHKDHKTTARDMALIMAAAMRNPVCREVLMTQEYMLPCTPQHPEGLLLTSDLFETVDQSVILAGKTGWTPQAQNTLVTYAVGADGHEYVCVTMGSPGHPAALADTLQLYKDYAGLE